MRPLHLKELFLAVVFLCCCLGGFLALSLWSPPADFPHEKTIRIEKGETVSLAAEKLQKEGIIRSAFWFKVFSILGDSDRGIIAGDYYFKLPESVSTVSNRISIGHYGIESVRVTIPEGFSIFQIADLLAHHFSLFDPTYFISIASEGYLFPDTYFFLSNATASDVVERMRQNFVDKTEGLRKEAALAEKDWEDIVTLASIIEEEAKHGEDRPIISDILWTRLDIGMPLQVDATFSYVNGKNTYTLSLEDLEDQSPYNTYEHRGLPPTPIANPGLASLTAALYPAETEYLYFLSDLDGNMYYAEDFEGHQRNRELYLRK